LLFRTPSPTPVSAVARSDSPLFERGSNGGAIQ